MTRIFGREFSSLSSEFLQDLYTLEEEGVMYTQFWQEETEDFRFCRIQFMPSEIVAYVDAISAYDEFLSFCNNCANPAETIKNISNNEIRNRVLEYNNWATSINQEDMCYCFAAFLDEDLESLLCGEELQRYEFLSQSYTRDRRFLLTEILEMFSTSAKYLETRLGNRPTYNLEEEQDVRDLLYAIIKGVFADARLEEHTRIHAGSAKRIDIVIPGISILIEVKFIRNPEHAKKIADELRIDFESYHIHQNCKTLIAYVWDAKGLLVDRANFINDLRGLRVKGESKFKVEVMVKP